MLIAVPSPLPTQIRLQVLADITYETLERQFVDVQQGRALHLADSNGRTRAQPIMIGVGVEGAGALLCRKTFGAFKSGAPLTRRFVLEFLVRAMVVQ